MMCKFFDPFEGQEVEMEFEQEVYEILCNISERKVNGLPLIYKSLYEEEVKNARTANIAKT